MEILDPTKDTSKIILGQNNSQSFQFNSTLLNKDDLLYFSNSYVIDYGNMGDPYLHYYSVNFETKKFQKNDPENLYDLILVKENLYSYDVRQKFYNVDWENNFVPVNTIIIAPDILIHLSFDKTIRFENFKKKFIFDYSPEDVQFESIFNYNDSLFLAGGSYQGKSALFFISSNTDSLQIKDKIVFQSFYGNINSIERTSDGEYLLIIENKKTHNNDNDTIPLKGIIEHRTSNQNKNLLSKTGDGGYLQVEKNEKDGFVLLKTKDLGKNASSVSFTPNIKQISNYISNEFLEIILTGELAENSILEIYNSLGQKVRFINNLEKFKNNQILKINLSDFSNSIPGNAVYFYLLKNGGKIQTGKFLLN
jgi:hypothetical protein